VPGKLPTPVDSTSKPTFSDENFLFFLFWEKKCAARAEKLAMRQVFSYFRNCPPEKLPNSP